MSEVNTYYLNQRSLIVAQNISENIILLKNNFINERFRLCCINFTLRSIIASQKKFHDYLQDLHEILLIKTKIRKQPRKYTVQVTV